MTKKTKDTICKLAQRMLAVQLEIDPKAKTTIHFSYKNFNVAVFWGSIKPSRWWCNAWHVSSAGSLEEVPI